ncbi:MAG: hypothetical protein OEV64_02565 [Desulfobulbaceae bacterium]|nr:hypothetical protein [Desulfobulbaceae bacterium]
MITPHGFGHAARACAVMEALALLIPIRLTIITMVPIWFFKESLLFDFIYLPFNADIGLSQKSSLEIDFPATLQALKSFYPPTESNLTKLRKHIRGSDLVLCDISPLGLIAAKAENIPSVLLENFTWDWIYSSYITPYPELSRFIDYLATIFQEANYRIQTQPVCSSTNCDLKTNPISRETRNSPVHTRSRLKICDGEKMVLITMGGIGNDNLSFNNLLTKLRKYPRAIFVAPGHQNPNLVRRDNLILLPRECGIFHPDLVAASDAVVGKTGYSTLAEVYNASVPWGFISRNDFPESPVLAGFIQSHMSGLEITAEEFLNGAWTKKVLTLLELSHPKKPQLNGAHETALFLTDILSNSR